MKFFHDSYMQRLNKPVKKGTLSQFLFNSFLEYRQLKEDNYGRTEK